MFDIATPICEQASSLAIKFREYHFDFQSRISECIKSYQNTLLKE